MKKGGESQREAKKEKEALKLSSQKTGVSSETSHIEARAPTATMLERREPWSEDEAWRHVWEEASKVEVRKREGFGSHEEVAKASLLMDESMVLGKES